MTEKYDVIVMGLGAMGSASLYQLSKRGVKVLGIDQFAPPHSLGSSHGETRIIRQVNGEGGNYFPLVQRAYDIWHELEDKSGKTLLHNTGGLIICPKDGGAQFHGQTDFVTGTASLAQAFDIDHKLLTADEISDFLDVINPQSNEHAYYETHGGILRPEYCVATQLNLAQQQGATIHKNERVLKYEILDDGVLVKTEKGDYHAEKLIVSTGAWIVDLVPKIIKDQLSVYRQVIYWFEADDITPFKMENFPWVIWIGDTLEDFITFFPTPDDGTPAVKIMTETYINATHPDTIQRTVQQAEIDHIYNMILRDRVTGITANCINSGVCMYTVTPDEHFIIDFHPDSDRIVLASPCSGHGFKHSSAIGEILAQLALDGKSELDISMFSLNRFNTQ